MSRAPHAEKDAREVLGNRRLSRSWASMTTIVTAPAVRASFGAMTGAGHRVDGERCSRHADRAGEPDAFDRVPKRENRRGVGDKGEWRLDVPETRSQPARISYPIRMKIPSSHWITAAKKYGSRRTTLTAR
jgi:hypothetical protein